MRLWPFHRRPRLTLADCQVDSSGCIIVPPHASNRDIAALAVEWTRLHYGNDRADALIASYRREGVKVGQPVGLKDVRKRC